MTPDAHRVTTTAPTGGPSCWKTRRDYGDIGSEDCGAPPASELGLCDRHLAELRDDDATATADVGERPEAAGTPTFVIADESHLWFEVSVPDPVPNPDDNGPRWFGIAGVTYARGGGW